jgi:hypothetical protein
MPIWDEIIKELIQISSFGLKYIIVLVTSPNSQIYTKNLIFHVFSKVFQKLYKNDSSFWISCSFDFFGFVENLLMIIIFTTKEDKGLSKFWRNKIIKKKITSMICCHKDLDIIEKNIWFSFSIVSIKIVFIIDFYERIYVFWWSFFISFSLQHILDSNKSKFIW